MTRSGSDIRWLYRGGGGRVAEVGAVASCEHAYTLVGYVMAGQSGDRRRNGAGRRSRAALDTGCQVEDGDDLTRVIVDVEIRVRASRYGTTSMVARIATAMTPGSKSLRSSLRPGGPTAVARGGGPRRRRPVAVDAASPSVMRDLDDGDHVVAVLAHEREVRLDVGAKHGRSG